MSDQLKTFYNVSDVMIAIEGDNQYAAALRKYFETEQINRSEGAEEQFLISISEFADESDFCPEYYSLSGKIAFNSNEYRIKKKNYVYRVKNLFDKNKPTILSINRTKKASVRKYITGYMNPMSVGVYKSADKFVNSIMNYEIFWYIFAMVLMKYDKIFVHSGMATYKEKAIVLAGTSGCGKTSTLLQFLDLPEGRYIAEDFGILGGKGTAYFNPKKAAIYQSDAKYKNKNILHALNGMKFREKFFWNAFKAAGANPRCRFSPYEIFHESKICKSAEVGIVVYMTRSNGSEVKKYKIDEKQMAEKITLSSFRELREFYDILYNIRAVGDEKIRDAYPALEKIEDDYKKILEQVLKQRKLCMLEVPLKVRPEEIAKEIEKETTGDEKW